MKLKIALHGGICIFAMASSAMAQQAGATAPGDAAQTAAGVPSPLDAVTVNTVTITGSRIIRNGYSAPTPITVAPVDQLQQTTPSSIPDGLNKLPQFAGSTTSASNSNNGGAPSVFGGNYLNLRSFGAIRTLILLDGRRVPSGALNGQVDVNTLPQMLVQRVDVVTGGASAVYGSDAVTGVVNFVLDKRFSGLKAVVDGGVSSHDDSDSNRLGLAGGSQVTERGHFIWSVERYKNNGVTRHEDRPWSAANPVYVGQGTAANPFMLVQNARLSNTSFGGLITGVRNGAATVISPLTGQQFLSDASLAPFNPGTPTATKNTAVGGDGGYFSNLNLTPPTITNQGFGRFDYDFTDNFAGYMQVGLAETLLSGQHSANMQANTFTIYNGNAFLPAAVQAALASVGPASSLSLSRLTRDLAYDSTQDQTTDALNFTTGLRGTVFTKFNWDAYYTSGEDRVSSRLTNNVNLPDLYAAVDAVKDPSGNIVCRVSLTNPGLYPGCAPLDPFGAGNVSAAAKAFIYQNTQWRAVQKLNDFEGNFSGDVFDNWAGPVSVAFNAEYRTQSLNQTSNANPLAVPSYTGIRGAPPVTASSTLYGYSVQGNNQGSNRVWETSAETVFPLLADLPMAKSLEATGAIRYTDYSSSGATRTWKYGANYQPIEDLRFRFTESQDIRAPTLTDLYSPTSVSQVTFTDPLTNQTQQISLFTSSNPNLQPEVARTTTVGLVYSPSFVPRLKMSVDYYRINIANAIANISGTTAGIAQECVASGGTSPVCAAIHRPTPTSFPDYLTSTGLNVSQNYTHGVDVEASYNFYLADIVRTLPGRVDLRLLYAYQPELRIQAYPSSQLIEQAGVAGLSASRVNATLNYRIGAVAIDWQARYYSPQARTGNPTLVYGDPYLPGIFYHDVSVNYVFKGIEAFLTVNNLFDQAPRISPTTNSASSPGFGTITVNGDDMVGRYFTLGLRARF